MERGGAELNHEGWTMISAVLKNDIEAFASRLRTSNRLLEQARKGMVTPYAVGAYLSNLMYLIREALEILSLAQGRASAIGHTELAAFYLRKMKEEKGHDQWAQNDIVSLNTLFGAQAVADRSPAILEMLSYLRKATEEDPVQYLAYLLFTEYVTVLIGPEWLRLLEEQCGVPASMMTVVSNHVELDKDHVEACLTEIDELVTDETFHGGLQRTLRESMQYFDAFCAEISRTIN
jgi:pyrroloquinoline quinone (PQQ) biosynthesis protein C